MEVKQKTVGILSMQRVVNYGSFLQAYALKQLLMDAGATDVSFIDICPGRPLKGYRQAGVQYWCKKMGRIFKVLFTFGLFRKIRDKRFYAELVRRFKNEYYSMLELDKPHSGRYDLVVIGSDEVFNCCQLSSFGFTRQLYGDIPEADRVVSYAGSFGHTTLSQLKTQGLDREIGELLTAMPMISVRDDNSREIVASLSGREVLQHLDPVLVHDFSEEINRIPSSISLSDEGCIVIYSYQERIRNNREIRAIREFARARGKRLVSIFCRFDWCDETVLPDTPFDVLAWFKKADYIITDTFHGTIFSIITQSRFCTLIRDSNQAKLTALLTALEQQSRIASSPDKIGQILMTDMDYTPTLKVIEWEKSRTKQYLKEALG